MEILALLCERNETIMERTEKEETVIKIQNLTKEYKMYKTKKEVINE